MFTASYIVAASQLFALAFGAPLLTSNAKQARTLVARTAYTVFGGDGTTGQGWPAESAWKSFDEAWDANVATTLQSCSQFSQENNSQEESDNIKKAIGEISEESGVDARFLLAIVMQESKGCVRVHTTNNGFDNPGLMQSFQGKHSCNIGGTVQNPCPYDQIKGMIADGAGLNSEVGLKWGIEQSGSSDVDKYYKAARIYNSGSIEGGIGGNLNGGIATHCYCTDVANRLIGWTDADSHDCDEATIGSVGGGSPSTSDPAPSDPAPSEPANTDGGNTDAPAADPAPSTGGACTSWYLVNAGDSCASTGVDMATLQKLNPGQLDDNCSNLQAGLSYCIA